MGNWKGKQEKFGGRPRKMNDQQVSRALELYFNEGFAVRDVADEMKLSHMTVWRAISRAGPEQFHSALAVYAR